MHESPAAERNKEPLLEALYRLLPRTGTVLEIASGAGQHVVHFAQALPQLKWQPSDPDPDFLAVIRWRLAEAGLDNVEEPLRLDVREFPWPVDEADAVLCINMIHVAPWLATAGLLQGAGELLQPGSALILYGPYMDKGEHTAPSNAAFDRSLKSRDPEWGVRDMDRVTQLAEGHGLVYDERIPMPANNFLVVYRRN